MNYTIKIKGGQENDIPQLKPRELGYCTDTGKAFIGTETGNKDFFKVINDKLGDGFTSENTITSQLNASVKKTKENINYYVSKSGNDNNDGLSESTPFATIQHAIDLVPEFIKNEIRINVAGGLYDEDIIVSGKYGDGLLAIIGSEETSVNRITLKNINLPFVVSTLKCLTTTKSAIDISRCVGVTLTKITNTVSAMEQIGIETNFSIIFISNCEISNKNYAILSSSGSIVFSNSNRGESNNTGLLAQNGGTIGKSGTQPNGATGETIYSGGVIR